MGPSSRPRQEDRAGRGQAPRSESLAGWLPDVRDRDEVQSQGRA